MLRVAVAWIGLTGMLACSGASLEILPLGDRTARVGETFVLEIGVSNPDGVEVTFAYDAPGLPGSGAEIYRMDASRGIFRWTPLPSHVGTHVFTFRVSGGGASDTESIAVTVEASDSAPVFLQPGAGGTFDLTRDPCVAVHIEVKDDDSAAGDITLSEREPRIDGGELTAAGKQGDWRWCPSPAQASATDRYTLQLAAQDRTHPAVTHDYVIVLRGEGRPDCPGSPPTIETTSPPPPNTLATSLDYRVEAVVRDDRGLKDAPLLYWSVNRPADMARPDVTAFSQVVFEAMGGDRFQAAIPNLGLAEGETRTLYYLVSATDNDDEAGTACDHRTDSPVREFTVAPGSGETVGYCEACSANGQCGSGMCAAGPAPFCAGDCAACPAGGACRTVALLGGRTAEACVPESGSCRGGGSCTDDRFEDNDARGDAAVLAPDIHAGLAVCPGDADFYLFEAETAGTADILIDGWNAAEVDIDLQLLRDDGTVVRTSAGLDDSEQISACLAPGLYLVRVYGIGSDAGPYDLLLDLTPGGCCTDDPWEDNDDYASATPILAPGDLAEGRICSGDEDWFEIALDAGVRVSADLEIDGGGDLDLELYDRDGRRRLAFSAGVGSSEHLEADVAAAGSYFLRVYGYSGAEADFLLEYGEGAGAGCSSSLSCPSGTVCGATGCVSDACTPGSSTCPAGTFCPPAGGTGGESDCADPCDGAADCRTGYACKVFPTGGGCAQAGAGASGAACTSFRQCAGELTCQSWPGGYCARAGCASAADCPADARCVQVGGLLGTCVKDCLWSDDECRLAEGYRCGCARDVAGGMRWVCLAPGVMAPSC